LARVFLIRALLFLAPFAVYAVWREVARRTGRPMGSTPWAWLVGAGASLAVLSLVAEAILPHGADHGRYVPAEVRPDGTVKPGHFEGR
jgi:4-amino-4-deoxy-L-arabinose transferase-like glycosyltransferase